MAIDSRGSAANNTGKARPRRKIGQYSQQLYVIAILPLLLFGLVVLIVGDRLIMNALIEERSNSLKSATTLAYEAFDATYPGDFELVGEGTYRVTKGGEDITLKYEIIDRLSKTSGLDMTLFYHDTRILTTIVGNDGKRIVGTGAAGQVQIDVLQGKKSAFYSNTRIGSETYVAYYIPILNADDEVVGMFGSCVPISELSSIALSSIMPLLVADLIILILMILIVARFAKNNVDAVNLIHDFLTDAASGNDSAELDPSVLSRRDEFGDIGSSVVSMHRSLREMMERDPLTHLFNRRSADRKLAGIMARSERTNSPFSIAIGDIDFFKKVNDTYGHEAGDIVLQTVADLAGEHMRNSGFVARWGGEEFLFVFDRKDQEEAAESLNELLETIRRKSIFYNDQTIRVTMSFGVVSKSGLKPDELIRISDDCLYEAKQNGRNRVVAAVIEKTDADDVDEFSEEPSESEDLTEETSEE